ncbi:MAG: glucosidase [Gammaproteobacteria bacterium]|nr:glucosidase [Gammaproteobacteria bacterium]MDH3767120.1 glucosidase [Gammaproteobacteria bacterium]
MRSPVENKERERLRQQHSGEADWYLWGPYLAERAWGTVREDYSADSDAWHHFPFEHAHARAYRWSEDGLGAISDKEQRVCFALSLWNERDPILKERAFGLTNSQGNRGEEVKEYYFYLDGTPTHSWMRYLYKYPQEAYPYYELIQRNGSRKRSDPSFGLIDTGIFEKGYWDVLVTYAKLSPEQMYIRIAATNRGDNRAALHLLPTLWFRNTWAWSGRRPTSLIRQSNRQVKGVAWSVDIDDQALNGYQLAGHQSASLLFTDNETNTERLWGESGPKYTKDAFNRFIVDGEAGALRENSGTRFAAARRIEAMPGETQYFDLWLGREQSHAPFSAIERTLTQRRAEADGFYDALQPRATTQDHRIVRQALAGMTWGKQFYNYDVNRWLEGDQVKPPEKRKRGRNSAWRHMRAGDIISMPDTWEYPWFAAWDLAYQSGPLALTDMGFAKQQLELLLGERYLHPTGSIPAYEWNFGDVNPPVHAAFALRLFRSDRARNGVADYSFLRRVFHKMLLNYAWWLNRKDVDGQNLFNGGFLGLDNISVFDRSRSPLPDGYKLVQADATGWMANYALNMTVIALEISAVQPDYEAIAIQCYEQFLSIAESISGYDHVGLSLWDESDGFFKDVVVGPDGARHPLDVYSWVGLIPLFACVVIGPGLLEAAPAFRRMLEEHRGGRVHGHFVSECPHTDNTRGEHLLALVNRDMLTRILARVLDEEQFLSPYGIRSLSRFHAENHPVGSVPGVGELYIEYVPGEANSPMYGGNSNWRGPVWLPTNYSLIVALERYHRYLGAEFTVPSPDGSGRTMTLKAVADLIADRLVDLYRRDGQGNLPAMRPDSPFQNDPHWQELCLFYEYFHAETGRGLGAAHQTGWTGLLANLVMRCYR